MVTSTVPATTTKTRAPHQACPRCAASMILIYDEPECLQCGYADYTYTPPTPIGPKSLMSSARRDVVRYSGDSRNLSDTLVYRQLQKGRNKAVYDVTCPFCESNMEQSSLSGKRREIREVRYRCPQGHRISLVPKRDGNMGWK